MFLLQVPAASDSDSEGDELVQQYLADSGDSDEDTLQGLPQWEQPDGGVLQRQAFRLPGSPASDQPTHL